MELKDQVSGLESAKKFRELGIKQESLWYWYPHIKGYSLCSKEDFIHKSWNYDKDKPVVSAFTVAELGERLPDGVTKMFEGKSCYWYLDIRKHDTGEWSIAYVLVDNDSDILIELNADTLKNAMEKMLIYLLENKLIKEG